MFSYIKGKVTRKNPAYVVLETGGIGYFINISLFTYGQIEGKQEGLLHIHQHIKEDAHTLYGFAVETERDLFRHLISVSGIGPSTAIVMLSSLQPEDTIKAIVHEDEATIKAIKGIGPKTAKRLILELKDKLGKEMNQTQEIIGVPGNNVKSEALAALAVLGIAPKQAEAAVQKSMRSATDTATVEALVKDALRLL